MNTKSCLLIAFALLCAAVHANAILQPDCATMGGLDSLDYAPTGACCVPEDCEPSEGPDFGECDADINADNFIDEAKRVVFCQPTTDQYFGICVVYKASKVEKLLEGVDDDDDDDKTINEKIRDKAANFCEEYYKKRKGGEEGGCTSSDECGSSFCLQDLPAGQNGPACSDDGGVCVQKKFIFNPNKPFRRRTGIDEDDCNVVVTAPFAIALS